MEKKVITRKVDIDSDLIFGKSIDEVIKYLQSFKSKYPGKNLTLEQEWSGYEDNYFEISFCELESDQEYTERINHENLIEMENQKHILYEKERHNKAIENQIITLQKQIKK